MPTSSPSTERKRPGRQPARLLALETELSVAWVDLAEGPQRGLYREAAALELVSAVTDVPLPDGLLAAALPAGPDNAEGGLA